MYEHTYPSKRFKRTIQFVSKHISKDESLLDLGVKNPLSSLLIQEGYRVKNTNGEDLDQELRAIMEENYTTVTAFEILEHLLNPYGILKNIKASKIVISVPLRLWFAPAYRSKTDIRDRHYHEFEDWQLEWLLEKTGWKIMATEKFTHPVKKIGIRPILRLFTPRYYLIYAERDTK
ncbi:methyltransferase domain-containing protein [Imtechella halotolerans]|uniref:Methyltransferase n=1 Tax=Imtechella halotolerans K1 TaxID=946077 RepID=I0WE06_9FLAO|nr:methyltransferase domain-containing protein [Imtechella halotolerans]EID74622.1 hypothetical protein W5A_08827 [Imtechella halotolerans K1]WMQ62470.1 methyltransferase [Imtechella halotolerans]